jgi:predicted N-acetyltransferase YhbS
VIRASPRAVGDTGSGSDPVGTVEIERAPSDSEGASRRVEYQVRTARITDIERLVALSGGQLGRPAAGQMDAADLLRQLVFLPHATVLVAERRRDLVGGAVLAIRPSVRAGGYVGTIDLLAVDPASEPEAVAASLIEECVRSAANKGCASVEVPQPDDPAERARWERQEFTDQGTYLRRTVAPAGRRR